MTSITFRAAGLLLCFFLGVQSAGGQTIEIKRKPWIEMQSSGGGSKLRERVEGVRAIVADCVVKSHLPEVVDFLNLSTTHINYATAESKIWRAVESCMYSRIGYGAVADFKPRDTIFVGKLSQAMLRRLTARPVLAVSDESAYNYKRSWMETSAYGSIQQMSFCLVDNHPEKIVALIAAKSGSKDESFAFANLIPDIGDCLAKGETLTLGRPEFRAVLAESLYHRVVEGAAPKVSIIVRRWHYA